MEFLWNELGWGGPSDGSINRRQVCSVQALLSLASASLLADDEDVYKHVSGFKLQTVMVRVVRKTLNISKWNKNLISNSLM
ncbi:hypothetical protein [Chitinimonas prasina]|uniref:hypothetical protein n=1 Tax=Chitinimonas prasina TaxID=1434937 RepID=UPI0024E0C3EB|nr:hypothetical protein [Chitinimonas prasina]